MWRRRSGGPGERSLCTSFGMRFHLSGSDLEVNFAPIPQCAPSRSDSSGDGACVVGVNTWRQAWLLCCALVQWLVSVVTLFSKGVEMEGHQNLNQKLQKD